jgi:hypothetical protein
VEPLLVRRGLVVEAGKSDGTAPVPEAPKQE